MEKEITELANKLQKTSYGIGVIKEEAKQFVLKHTEKENFNISKILIESETYQVRAFATFILGFICTKSEPALEYLRINISKDTDWRVQEILAKVFDQYCSDIGYYNSLSIISEWLKDKNPNTRRAVTEGLRIWTNREYFKDNPSVAIKLLSNLKSDESEYVRKSVGNALKDISKKYKELIKNEVSNWDLGDKYINYTYGFASKYLN